MHTGSGLTFGTPRCDGKDVILDLVVGRNHEYLLRKSDSLKESAI